MAFEQGVKLNKKRPLGIKQNYDNALAIPLTGQVIVGDVLLSKLSDIELKALLGHELTHLKQNHSVKLILLASYGPMLAASPLIFLGAPDIVFYVVSFAVFCLVFSIVSRRNERLADVGAGVIASPEAAISLLKHIVPQNRWRLESETHPSVLRRVLFLRKRFRSSLSHPKPHVNNSTC